MSIAAVLGKSENTELDLIHLSRKGIDKSTLLHLQEHMQLSQQEMAQLLHLSPRTLQRMHAEDKLSPAVSGQLIELAKVFARASEVLHSEGQARLWLRTPVQALGGNQPLQLLDTPTGLQWVLTVLGRIEYGIFS